MRRASSSVVELVDVALKWPPFECCWLVIARHIVLWESEHPPSVATLPYSGDGVEKRAWSVRELMEKEKMGKLWKLRGKIKSP